MTAVKKYRAVIWKETSYPFCKPWFVSFMAPTGRLVLVDGQVLHRRTHAEALQAACRSLRMLNAAAMAQPREVVDP